ncbi:MAG TPA: RluA family pseudouridine synthase [Kiritimatiellia bacterium]|nr:RluA family pseudouridine synthase [Kiritimatiellia bacterium]
MPTSQQLVVRQPERGLALDRFLTMRLGVSRKQAKRMLDERLVFVNRRRVWIAHHELKNGDTVEVPATREPEKISPAALRVIHEDAACIVVDKPAGLPTNGPVSAETQLRARFPEILPVHRLDRDTSGCLLFARSSEAQANLEKQFEDRTVDKLYQAIAIGLFPLTLTRMERPVGGLTALTEFKLLRRNPVASHIEAHPRTGRTHQIRVHLQAAGFPLAGDRAYATRAVKEDILREMPRQMLHAWRLVWRDPLTGDMRRAQATPPNDFRDALVALKLVSARATRGGGK